MDPNVKVNDSKRGGSLSRLAYLTPPTQFLLRLALVFAASWTLPPGGRYSGALSWSLFYLFFWQRPPEPSLSCVSLSVANVRSVVSSFGRVSPASMAVKVRGQLLDSSALGGWSNTPPPPPTRGSATGSGGMWVSSSHSCNFSTGLRSSRNTF